MEEQGRNAIIRTDYQTWTTKVANVIEALRAYPTLHITIYVEDENTQSFVQFACKDNNVEQRVSVNLLRRVFDFHVD